MTPLFTPLDLYNAYNIRGEPIPDPGESWEDYEDRLYGDGRDTTFLAIVEDMATAHFEHEEDPAAAAEACMRYLISLRTDTLNNINAVGEALAAKRGVPWPS